MRGYNKFDVQPNAKKTDEKTVPRRMRNNQPAAYPQLPKQFKKIIKEMQMRTRQQLRNRNPVPKKTKPEGKGIDKFKVALKQPQQKQMQKKPKAFISRPAPSNQYKMYLCDTDNVFYQDSADMKNLRRIRVAKFYLTIFVIFMSFCYVGIGRIVPYPKEKCPQHAVCNVFVHCHQGYARVNNTCIIDPQIINKAKEISEAVVRQLSYNHGQRQCVKEGEQFSTQAKLLDVFDDFNVQDDILKNQIVYFFVDKANQAHYQFSFRANRIKALSSKYSLSCSTTLFIRSSSFKYYLLAFILLIFASIRLMRSSSQLRKARRTYQFLKRKTLFERELCISSVKRQSQELIGPWTSELWSDIDMIRSKDGCIAYYIQLQELYWKRLD